MFSINMCDSHMFSLSLSTWTWDTFLMLRGTQGFYLNHVLPPRPSKSFRVDGTAGFLYFLPHTVYLDLRHLPHTQGWSGLLSEP